MAMEGEGLQHHQAGSLDYQAAAGHCQEADYATHARRLIECLSDEISWVYYENISFPASVNLKRKMVTTDLTD